MKEKPAQIPFLIFLAPLALLPFLLALAGPPAVDPRSLFETASGDGFIFWHLRLPRHLLAFIVGASLSMAGAAFQALLKNPLADPYILGVSGGAALGYVLAVVAALPFYLVPAAGFSGALAALAVIYFLARSGGALNAVNLLLTGIIFNSFSFALILAINALAPFGQSQQILHLLLGAIEPVAWPQLALVAALSAVSALLLCLRADRLNLMSLGEEEAFHLGVDVNRERTLVFLIASLLVGASVSLCGLIGFVGLFVPHLVRLAKGADHRTLLPLCAFGGGIFLMLADVVAGHLFTGESLQTRLPVGVITALVGAPAFAFLLKKQTNGGFS